MREVAEAAGVSKAAIYHHFADKETLFLALLLGAVAQAGDLVDSAAALAGPTSVKLHALLTGFSAHRNDQQAAMRLAEREAVHLSEAGRTQLFQEYRTRFTAPIERLMAAGQATGDLRADDPRWQASSLLLLAQALLGPSERGVSVDTVLNTFLHGAGAG